MSARKPRISNTRDLGFGAGKGDAPRHIFNESWRANYSAINWPGVQFERSGVRLVKRYKSS